MGAKWDTTAQRIQYTPSIAHTYPIQGLNSRKKPWDTLSPHLYPMSDETIVGADKEYYCYTIVKFSRKQSNSVVKKAFSSTKIILATVKL
ncbi:hypothetical protein WA1_50830 [Scytonema hofmannii PCC 7110]|uniref:Uncharacterized protein n=1 Tax=Scytonema hofmannii PCC 7110 TaxID=128403 RepID=A0A139WQ23_9CYAN|nr:hypothetical protein WA1_50830 [Scytonema hofmannii PCC 7110]